MSNELLKVTWYKLDMRSVWFNKLSPVSGHRLRYNWLLLCLLGVIALVALLSSSSSSREFDPSEAAIWLPDVYANYRKLKEQAVVDYFDLRFLAAGTNVRQKELPLCGKERDNYVPCYNVSANLLAGFKDGEEFDRHCQFSRSKDRCVVRPPKEYKIPLRYPAGRDVIWTGNVKITKDQFLSSGTMTKRYSCSCVKQSFTYHESCSMPLTCSVFITRLCNIITLSG